MSKKNAPAHKKPRTAKLKAIEHADLIARSLFAVDVASAEDALHVQGVLDAVQNDGGLDGVCRAVWALNQAVVSSAEGHYFDDLISRLEHEHPTLEERLREISIAALDYSDRTWREGYLVGLAVGRRTAGGAR